MNKDPVMSFPENKFILQYKDEGKSHWLDFRNYPPDKLAEAYEELQSLDQTKYKLIIRCEAAIT